VIFDPSPGRLRLVLDQGELDLLAGHAVFEPLSRSLLVADLHLGKGLTFRRHGLPVPAGSSADTLARLDRLIGACQPERLVVLGDLLHGPQALHALLLDRLIDWRARHRSLAVSLVDGNHDRRAGQLPADCGIESAGPSLRCGPWVLTHAEPDRVDAGFVIAGHVHPVIRLHGANDSLRRPCFWLRAQALVLPAFGELTGGWLVRPTPGERVFVAAGDTVLEVPPAALPGRRRPLSYARPSATGRLRS
jgi:DNA ligase-associated metallophosphoesterase